MAFLALLYRGLNTTSLVWFRLSLSMARVQGLRMFSLVSHRDQFVVLSTSFSILHLSALCLQLMTHNYFSPVLIKYTPLSWTVCCSVYVEIKRTSYIRQYLTVEATISHAFGFVLSRLDYCNYLPIYLLRRLPNDQNYSAKLGFKASKRDHGQPLLQALHCYLSRPDYFTNCQRPVTVSSLAYPLPTSLTFALCTLLPGSFVLLQIIR